MKQFVLLFLTAVLTGTGSSQSTEETRMQITGSATSGLNTILGGYSTGVFSNTIYYAGTLGLRKNNISRFSFYGFEAGIAKRGIRVNRYWGAPLLPEKGNSYKNRYASFQFFIGKYYNESAYVKFITGIEYLFYSDQYDFKNTTYYRSVNRISPLLELAWGRDLHFSSQFKGFLEITSGILLLRPNFFHFGLRAGFYLREQASDNRTY